MNNLCKDEARLYAATASRLTVNTLTKKTIIYVYEFIDILFNRITWFSNLIVIELGAFLGKKV